jgi:hypothetical protein
MSPRPGGWVRLDATKDAPSGFHGKVFLRLRESAGRMRVRQAFMDADDPVSARTWRHVPLAEVEAFALRPEFREVLEKPVEMSTEIVNELDRYFDDSAARYFDVADWVPEMPDHPDLDLPHMYASYQPLRSPEGRITPEFLQQVAVAYRRAAAERRKPAPVMAEEARVPIRTVHGWITQARKQGYLPPGRKGRVG